MHASPTAVHLRHLPGMQGEIFLDRWFVRGLRRGGLEDSSVYHWTKHRWPLRNLRDRAAHRAAAWELAERLTAFHAAHPGRPMVLTGHSTGALVVIETLANLEAGVVTQAWLISAAASRSYDLRPALAKVGRMVNVYSRLDWLTLSAGTTLFGTADGRRGAAAGWGRFTGPGSDSPKLEQWPHRLVWLKRFHGGGHLAPLNTAFARHVIAPAIVAFGGPGS